MKILYKVGFSCKFILNNEKIIETLDDWSNLHYGEPIGFDSNGNNAYIYDSFDDAMATNLPNCFKDLTVFGAKECIRVNTGMRTCTVKEKNFKQLIITAHIHKIKPSYYTFRKLMDELSLEEFIEYCNDNGLMVNKND